MVRTVDAAPGIAVLEPGAADLVVLVDHGERDAGLLQPMGGEDPGHAGADDQDVKLRLLLGRDRLEAGLAVGILAVERQLLRQELDVLLGERCADHPVHHLAHRRGVGRRRQRAAAVAICPDRLERELASLLLLVERDAALQIDEVRSVGFDVAAQDAWRRR